MNDLMVKEDSGQGLDIFKPRNGGIDLERLNRLWDLSGQISTSAVVPKTLTHGKVNGASDTEFAPEIIQANVFAVVEQADRLGVSPFALLQASAIIHGRLSFEGKVIHAILESVFRIELDIEFTDEGKGDEMGIILSGKKPGSDKVLTCEGTVKTWRTTGNNSAWSSPAAHKRMLIYRGTREWARMYKPSAILGMISEDEALDIMEARAQNARDVTNTSSGIAGRVGGGRGGFNSDEVSRELEDQRGKHVAVNKVEEHALKKEEVSVEVKAEDQKPTPKKASTKKEKAAEPEPKADEKTQDPGEKAQAAEEPTTEEGSISTDGQLDLGGEDSAAAGNGADAAEASAESPHSDSQAEQAGSDNVPQTASGPSADDFLKYNQNLFRCGKKENLKPVDEQYWAKLGFEFPENTKRSALREMIFQSHIDRFQGGNMSPPEMEKHIKAEIAKVFKQ